MAVLTSRMQEAVTSGWQLALLAAVDHPSGFFYAWTGVGLLEWDGHTWIGVGVLGGAGPVKRTSELQIQEIQLRLTGIPPEQARWLSSVVRGREAQLWLAAISPTDGQVVRDPYPLVLSLMDYQTYQIDESSAPQLSIVGQTGFYTLDRALDEVWSTEAQRGRDPTDTGLDQMAVLANQTVNWTRT